ncbi:MAG: S1 RNA-binding domain-containing protein, partial [Acutalibacteraceae bacterium]|nr:S1 RNA-binding domain-containing protein [Acutalibacteraceae bacterium]
IKHPSEVVNVGDTVKVYVKALDSEKRKISLGYKRVEDNPWEILRRDYPVDSVVDATVVGLTTFGAFATVIDGIDGLIHISQIADRHIASPKEVLSVGEVVKAKITEIDFDKKRVSLSIRALLEPAAEAEEVAEEVAEEAVEEVAEEAAE